MAIKSKRSDLPLAKKQEVMKETQKVLVYRLLHGYASNVCIIGLTLGLITRTFSKHFTLAISILIVVVMMKSSNP